MATATTTESVASLAKKHQRLRWQLPWLLGGGALLGLALLYAWLAQPTHASLAGYRFRQVGVRADGTRWLLAYRGGQAEILFCPADTSQGWQRHALGVDSAEAQALALDWGGKALLVSRAGVVRVYDSLLRPVDSLRRVLPPPPPDSSQQPRLLVKQRPSVVADRAGKVAIVITEAAQVYRTNDGGRHWVRRRLPKTALLSSFFLLGKYAKQPIETGLYSGLTSTSTGFRLATRRGLWYVSISNSDTAQTWFDSRLPFVSFRYGVMLPWRRSLSAAVAWCGILPNGKILAVDRQGNWVGRDTAGSDANARDFFAKTIAVAPLDSSGNFLGISATQLFQQRVAFFTGASASRPASAAPKTPAAKPAAKTPSAPSKTSARLAGSSPKTKRTSPSGSSALKPKSKAAVPTAAPPAQDNAPDQQTLKLIDPSPEPQGNPAVQQKPPTKDNQRPRQTNEPSPSPKQQ